MNSPKPARFSPWQRHRNEVGSAPVFNYQYARSPPLSRVFTNLFAAVGFALVYFAASGAPADRPAIDLGSPPSSDAWIALATWIVSLSAPWLALALSLVFGLNVCAHLTHRRAFFRAAARSRAALAAPSSSTRTGPSSFSATAVGGAGFSMEGDENSWWPFLRLLVSPLTAFFSVSTDSGYSATGAGLSSAASRGLSDSRLDSPHSASRASPARSLPSPPASPGRTQRRQLHGHQSPPSSSSAALTAASTPVAGGDAMPPLPPFSPYSPDYAINSVLRSPASAPAASTARSSAASPVSPAGGGAAMIGSTTSPFQSPVSHALTTPSTPTSWLTNESLFLSDEGRLNEASPGSAVGEHGRETLNYREVDQLRSHVGHQGGAAAAAVDDWFDSFSSFAYRVSPMEKEKKRKRQPGIYDEQYQDEARQTLVQLGLFKELSTFTERIRMWFSAYVIKPLAKKIDFLEANPPPQATSASATAQPTLGGGGFKTPATSSFFSFNKSPMTPATPSKPVDPHEKDRLYVARALAVPDCDDKPYVIQRIRELSAGSCVSAFQWNGGGLYKGKKWSTRLPSDSALLAHFFCVFMDACLPDNTNSAQPCAPAPSANGSAFGSGGSKFGSFGGGFGRTGGSAFGGPSSASKFSWGSPSATSSAFGKPATAFGATAQSQEPKKPASMGNVFSQKYFCVFPHQPSKVKSDLILFFDYHSPPHFECVTGLGARRTFHKVPLNPQNFFFAVLLFVKLCLKNKQGYLEGVSLADPTINLKSIFS